MNIYRNLKYMAVAAICAAGMMACNNEPEELNNFDIVFELLDEGGKAISGTQEFTFGEPLTYALNFLHVGLISVDTPEGWMTQVDISQKTCTITPPIPENLDGADSGELVFNIEANRGKTGVYKVAVSAGELALDFSFDAPSGVVKFAKDQTRKYEFTGSGGFGTIEFGVPTGWTAEYTRGDDFFTLTSPAEFMTNDDVTVSITPISARGEKGNAVSFMAKQFDTSAPDIIPETENPRVKLSTPKAIGIENKGAAKIDVLSKPGGWTVTPDITGNKITVTPPADIDSAGAELGGTISFRAWEAAMIEEIATEFEIAVRLDGIADMTDLNALKADYMGFIAGTTEEVELDKYMSADGEIVLLRDIATVTTDCCITGNGGTNDDNLNTFVHVFNGLGHTIDLDITSNHYKFAGLFQQVSQPGGVKNLNVTGKITATHLQQTGAWAIVGGITLYSVGASFSNITTDIRCTYNANNAEAASHNTSHIYGSIAARCKGTTPSYFTDCHTKGYMDMTHNGCFRYLGGLVGYINTETPTEFTRCSNTGNIDYTIPSTATGGNIKGLGGIVGWIAEPADTKMTDCLNSGSITIDADGRTPQTIVGGIAGRTSGGTFKRCVNTGNMISNGTGNNTRQGGIIGLAQGTAAGTDLVIDDCHNRPDGTDPLKRGEVTGPAQYVGGIISLADGFNGAKITNCTNKGVVGNTHATQNAMYVGGICGFFKGDLVENCTNEGEIKGNVDRSVGGLLGRADMGKSSSQTQPAVIKNCTNKGVMNTTTTLTAKSSAGWLPLVAGVVVIANATETNVATVKSNYYSLEGCTNEAKVNAWVTHNGCAQNIWAFTTKHRADNPALEDDTANVKADTSTSAAQLDPDGNVNEILKGN